MRSSLLVCVTTLLWTSAGFPLVVACWGALRPAQHSARPITPSVSIIIARTTKKRTSRERSRILSARYTRHLMKSSWPRTAPRTHTVRSRKVLRTGRSSPIPSSRGKIHALNKAVMASSGRVLSSPTRNTGLGRRVLQSSVRNFADTRVGGVCGNQIVQLEGEEESTADANELLGVRQEDQGARERDRKHRVRGRRALRIRRELYVCPANPALNDDFAISTRVVELGSVHYDETAARVGERLRVGRP